MKHFYLKIITIIFVIAAVQPASAQITVNSAVTLQQLIQRFVGNNVTILNPTINCPTTHRGTFDVTSSNLGLPTGGIILSSGVVQTAGGNIGANGPASGFVSQDQTISGGDPQLNALIGSNSSYDPCVLQFDFSPEVDTISTLHFQYVFASDEYPEFACSQFNDVFGFFISGPGIAGSQNIALVPNTNIPVAINSINMAPNGSFYSIGTCNAMGPGAPFSQYYVNNANGTTISYDGFTTVLTANATVSPCDTYHMKLAIEDVGDASYQSAVFLKANSFSVDSSTVNFSGGIATNGGYLVEGCTPAILTFTHDTASHLPKKICLAWGGTATNGVDYPLMPDSVMIPAGVVSTTLSLDPLQDGIVENPEVVTIYQLNCCSRLPKDSIKITIRDSLYMTLLSHDTFFCSGSIDTTFLHVTGDTAYTYMWTPATGVVNPNDTSTIAFPTQTTTYTATAYYQGCPPVSRSVTTTIEPLPVVDIALSDTSICLIDPLLIHASVSPQSATYTYTWSPGVNLDNPNILEPTFYTTADSTFEYVLAVTTPHGCTGKDSISIRTLPGVTADIAISDTSICSNDSLLIHVNIFPPDTTTGYVYTWTPGRRLNDPSVKEPTFFTTNTTPDAYQYNLLVHNPYGCMATDSITIHTLLLPRIDLMKDTGLCLHEPLLIHMSVEPADSQFTYSWSPTTWLDNGSIEEPTFFTPLDGFFNYTVTVHAVGGCTNVDSIKIQAYPLEHLKVVSDKIVKYGDYIQLEADSALYYFWTPDKYLDNPNINRPIAHALEPVIYTVYGMNQYGCRDTGEVKVDIDYTMDEFIPSAFSPNGDGKNDVFRAVHLGYQRLIEFRVFNRWGQELFSTTDQATGWDGTFKGQPADPGVYHYLIRVAIPNGEQRMYKGDVTLVR